MIKILHKIVNPPYFDKWTSIHMAAGAFICKVCLWLGFSAWEAVFTVAMIGLLWEVAEWHVEGLQPYGSFHDWFRNTMSDLVVETGIAIWIVI